MLTIPNDPDVLRNKIREDLDILDTDELKELYRVIARSAAKKAVRFADSDWSDKGLSRNLVKSEVNAYRQSTAEK